ncbi:MAG: ParA family protein [Candidatus Aenigmarchaeota archaeon]|nr:ParA family protein [Candidatus Aenigmarchaeota archaeon]
MNIKIAIANQKGGVGKTDLAVNLSSYLANFGKRVLLIDMDPQANTTDYVGKFNPKLTTYDLLMDKNISVKDVAIKTQVDNLDLIPSSRSLAKAEVQLINEVGMQFRLKRKLNCPLDYDFVFMDTPPSLGLLTINALTAADEVIIPIEVHYFPLEGVSKLCNTIDAIKEEINPKLNINGFILTMFDRRNNLSFEVEKIVRSTFKEKVYKVFIPINVRLAEAPSHHKPIMLYDKKSTGAQAYYALAEEFLKRRGKLYYLSQFLH